MKINQGVPFSTIFFHYFIKLIPEKALPLPYYFKQTEKMKKVLLVVILLTMGLTYASAQKKADIKFDKTTHDFGTFSENNPKVSCTFKFTNTGDDLLIIHQAVASCGCTVPEYTKEPVKPGESGEIKVTYNGAGKYPGHFKKSITIRSNAKNEMTRLYIEGNMTAKDVSIVETGK